jgi:predicted O-linked N-acetylglucosamine transferase (SPINDLY family)
MLKLLGLDDLIAADRADYVRIAIRLANDPGLRAGLGERIRAAKRSLYRDQGVVVALAHFLRTVEAPPERATRSYGAA